MEILIRKEPNGSIYLDKQNACYFETLGMDKPPYNFRKITIEDGFADCEASDFNDDLTFNTIKYSERKSKELTIKYENMIVNEIRKKYSLNQELAILRQRDSKFYEYQEYFDYVEQCKAKAKQFFNMV